MDLPDAEMSIIFMCTASFTLNVLKATLQKPPNLNYEMTSSDSSYLIQIAKLIHVHLMKYTPVWVENNSSKNTEQPQFIVDAVPGCPCAAFITVIFLMHSLNM